MCFTADSGVQQITFARTRSDAVVKTLDAEHLDEHKARRAEHKSVSEVYACRDVLIRFIGAETTRYTNPLKRKFRAKRMAAEGVTCSSCLSARRNSRSIQSMAPRQRQHPNDPMSKCRTSISLPTKFYFYKIFPKMSRKINSWFCFLSCVILRLTSILN